MVQKTSHTQCGSLDAGRILKAMDTHDQLEEHCEAPNEVIDSQMQAADFCLAATTWTFDEVSDFDDAHNDETLSDSVLQNMEATNPALGKSVARTIFSGIWWIIANISKLLWHTLVVIFFIRWIPTLLGMLLVQVSLRLSDRMGSPGDKPYAASSFGSKVMAFLAVMFTEFALLDWCLERLSGKMGFEYTSLSK